MKKKSLNFLKFYEKSQKNIISRKLKRFEQSYLEASILTPESTLTAHNKVRNFKFGEKINSTFEKITKNVISRRILQGFEQSYLKARFTTPELP